MNAEQGRYELWDIESANAVGEYDSEEAALRVVAETAALYGPDAPEVLSLSLIRLDVPDQQGRIAAGAALVTRALAGTDGPRYARAS